MYKKIYLDDPNIGESEKRFLARAIDSTYVSSAGPFVTEFEKRFARLVGARKAVSTQNGTSAIHMALYELGIGKGDEVIVPSLTFVATVNPIIYVGARPVFVDVDPATWNINCSGIERHITAKTKAIIPVHLYGNPCDMTGIMHLAKKRRLKVIEDATESLGAKYGGRHTGTFGELGCFSFNGNKIITTGGGGMVVGNDAARIGHIRFLVNQARRGSGDYFHQEVGFNYRMTNLEAAMGLAQIKKLEGFLRKKKRFNEIYRNELEGVCGISFQKTVDGAESSCWFTCITLEGKFGPAALQKKLKECMIPSRRVFMPVQEFPMYKIYRKGECPIAISIYEKGLCLPGSMLNSADDIRHICKVIKSLMRSI